MTASEAKGVLEKAELKVTQQRIAVLLALQNREDHPTAETVYSVLQETNPGITLATVYKILDTLSTSGIINKVMTQEGIKRYDPIVENHGHIYCSNTNEIIDFYDEELNSLIHSFIAKKKLHNLRIKNVSLQICGDKVDPGKKIQIN